MKLFLVILIVLRSVGSLYVFFLQVQEFWCNAKDLGFAIYFLLWDFWLTDHKQRRGDFEIIGFSWHKDNKSSAAGICSWSSDPWKALWFRKKSGWIWNCSYRQNSSSELLLLLLLTSWAFLFFFLSRRLLLLSVFVSPTDRLPIGLPLLFLKSSSLPLSSRFLLFYCETRMHWSLPILWRNCGSLNPFSWISSFNVKYRRRKILKKKRGHFFFCSSVLFLVPKSD